MMNSLKKMILLYDKCIKEYENKIEHAWDEYNKLVGKRSLSYSLNFNVVNMLVEYIKSEKSPNDMMKLHLRYTSLNYKKIYKCINNIDPVMLKNLKEAVDEAYTEIIPEVAGMVMCINSSFNAKYVIPAILEDKEFNSDDIEKIMIFSDIMRLLEIIDIYTMSNFAANIDFEAYTKIIDSEENKKCLV